MVAIVRLNGRSDAGDFIRALDPRPKARFDVYFERLRDGRHIKNPENMRHLETRRDGVKLHELKVHVGGGLRLYVIQRKHQWLATHGAKKVKDNRVPAEIRKAFDIFDEWLDNQEE